MKSKRYKPPVDAICALRTFFPNKPWTVTELRREVYGGPASEVVSPTFLKWAKRLGLIESVGRSQYVLTKKGDRSAAKSCGNWSGHKFGRGPRGGARFSTRQR